MWSCDVGPNSLKKRQLEKSQKFISFNSDMAREFSKFKRGCVYEQKKNNH